MHRARTAYIPEVPKRNAIVLVVICLSCLAAYAASQQGAAGRRLGEVLSLVRSSYFEPVDEDRLVESALDAAIAQLDEHSAYVRGDRRVDLEATLDQEFGGVGMELMIQESSGIPVVFSPVIDSPAWRAGIRSGDRIEAVDGETTLGVPLRETIARLRGTVGEAVMVRVATPSADTAAVLDEDTVVRREVSLVRELIETDTVLGDRRNGEGRWEWMLEGVPGVGYVRITSFGERTSAELTAALDAIEKSGEPRGLIMDLRGNPGGLLMAAVAVCDLLLDEGIIMHTRTRRSETFGDSALDSRRATSGSRLAGVPIVVLVDGLTASAAEIVAASLQDAHRVRIVGSRTFGKGTVQSILSLTDDRGLLKLTTAEYLRPSRASIHRRDDATDGDAWGVVPDPGCEVAPSAESTARVVAWRRSRDAAGPVPAWLVAHGLPRDVDPVLAHGIESLARPRQAADLGGEEETSGHDHDAVMAGE